MNTRQIEISKGAHGIYRIKVDGTPWGYASPQSNGSRGQSYTLMQRQGQAVRVPTQPPGGTRPDRGRSVSINGDALAAKINHGPVEPFADRLLTLVKSLIADGHLRDPAVIAAEERARAVERRQHEQAAIDAKRKRFADKAKDKIMETLPPGSLLHHQIDQLAVAMVDVMEWAQGK